MKIDDPNLLSVGDRVRRQANGPIWTVRAGPRLREGRLEVGVWKRGHGWRVFPFASLILIERKAP